MPGAKGTDVEHNCQRCEGADDERMVQCDSCDQWLHFSCANVDSRVADISWNCQSCGHISDPMAAVTKESEKSNKLVSFSIAPPTSASSPELTSQNQHILSEAPASLAIRPTLMYSSIYTVPRLSIAPASVSTYVTTSNTPTYADVPLHNQNRFQQPYGTTNVPAISTATSNTPTYADVPLHNQNRFQQPYGTTNVPAISTATNYQLVQQINNNSLMNFPMQQDLPTRSIGMTPSLTTKEENANAPTLATNSQRLDTSERMRALQLERLEEEMRIQQQYLDSKYKILTQFGDLNTSSDRTSMLNPGPTPAQLAAKHAIPKQLPTFNGDPEEWPLFISQFENSTAVAGYSNAENLMRLQACLKGKARDLVKNKLLLPAMVPDIIETLRMCCGRPEYILERAIAKAKNMPPLKDKLEPLIEFSLCVQNICATMESCNLDTHLMNPLLVKELVDKLPNNYKLNWAMYAKDERIPIVKVFSDWLRKIAEAASTVVSPMGYKSSANVNTHTQAEVLPNNKGESSVHVKKCSLCKVHDHNLSQCEAFKSLPLKRKWEVVKEHNVCRQCLGSHRRKCYINQECGIEGCKYKHHKLLHRSITQPPHNNDKPCGNAAGQMIAHSSSAKEKGPFFRIIPVQLHSQGKFIETFAFLDEGSAVTLIEKSMFEKLELKGVQEPLCLRWTGDTTRTEYDSFRTNVEISGAMNDRKFKLLNARTVENLSLPAQTIDVEGMIKRYPYLAGLPIQSYTNARPTILIGSDNWRLAIPLKIREGSWYQPIASKTRLGWALQGCHTNPSHDFMVNVHVCECEKSLSELHDAVKNYFSLEDSKPMQLLSADDNRALAILNATCKKVNDRFEVGLLWRNKDITLPDSYTTAYKRLMCLENKFSKDPQLRSTIQRQIDNLILKGYAKRVSPSEAAIQISKTWYLPIFTVTNPNKPGKIRLVWDAAAKSNGVCLNDFLFPGPDLLNSLVEVLLSFRVGRVAVCGDIAEMFHRINVTESDMHAQRFLWCDEGTKRPNVYVMRALSFGLNCAPCIAHYVRDKNAEQYRHEFPRAVEAVQRYHYVDDFIDSENDEESALLLARQVKQINASAGFEVRNWASNSPKVLQQLVNNGSTDSGSKEWGSTTKILGMYWEPTNDVFRFNCRFARLRRNVLNEAIVPTKRECLQILMSIFDPLGFLSANTIGLKVLLQDIWRAGIDWDESLRDALYDKWCKWKSTIPDIMDVRVPRCYSTILYSANSVQLHTFVDASATAFAAVSYLRIQQNDDVEIAFIAAKSKVAPLKPISIPRLELQAAVSGVRLANNIVRVPRICVEAQFWWTDSKTVLQWLRIDPKNFQQFVMHRVGEILESSNVSQWRWVPTRMNPADLATKTYNKVDTDMWFNGPDFLKADMTYWPSCDEFYQLEETELKRPILLIDKLNLLTCAPNVEYFSDWKRLYRAVATFILYITKLKAASKSTVRPQSIDSTMVQTAKTFLIRYAQRTAYEQEIKNLKSGMPMGTKSKLIGLNIYLDDNDVIRSRGREQFLNNHEDNIVLPSGSHITFLIVRSFHESLHHQSHETAINAIKGRYFIPQLRRLYKKVRRLCQHCKNLTAMPRPPQMAALPAARLAIFQRPFTFVGVDYFGPLHVSVGRRREKRWGVVFTCLTIRAIHIEVAHSLDTSSCIMCFRNFMARRGTPREVFSDNGTNFKASEKILRDEFKNIDQQIVCSTFDGIKWRFNPPGAPHMGGIWERLIRSVKSTLSAICPSMQFNDESLRSALWEIEFIINSRPLTFVSLESDDDEAITPNHLLIGSSDGYKPFGNDNNNLRQRWHQTQKFANQFWARWLKEYVPIISRRSKWFSPQPAIRVGDIVVIADSDLPRNCWPKGKVIDTVVASDGQVRRATVKTQFGILSRPSTRIAVLDVATNTESNLDKQDSLTGEGIVTAVN